MIVRLRCADERQTTTLCRKPDFKTVHAEERIVAQLCRSETALDRRLFAFRPYPSPSGRHRASPGKAAAFLGQLFRSPICPELLQQLPQSPVVKDGRARRASLGDANAPRSGHPRYWAMTNEHAAQPARRNVGLLIRKYLTFLPLIGFLVTRVIALVLEVDDWKVTALEVGLFWLVGVSGILLGSAHLFTPAPVAKAIGWPTSRFQWEVGLAGVGYGVAGVMAPAFDRGFWLATSSCSRFHTRRRGRPRPHLLVRHPGAGLHGRHVRRHALTTSCGFALNAHQRRKTRSPSLAR